MKPRATVAFAWLASLIAAAEVPAQSMEDIRTGARVRVEVPGPRKPQTLVGVLVSRTPDTLQLRLDRSNDLIAVPVDHLRQLEVSLEQHSASGRGAWGGFILGATLGLAAGFSCDCGQPGLAAVTFGAILGGLGTGVGALMGMGGRVDEWTPVISPAPQARKRSEIEPKGITLLQLQF